MNQERSQETEFARRLRAELTTIVANRGAAQAAQTNTSASATRSVWRLGDPRIALASVAVIVLAAAALIVSASGGDTSAAFAVEAEAEGEVSVEIHSLEDAKGLEEALGEAGVPASVSYLANGMTCKQPRFQPAPWPDGARAISMARVTGDGPFAFSGPLRFSISGDAVGPNQTLIITASASADGLFSVDTKVEIAEGAVAPCEPVSAT
jgi:hypothetical protein